MSNRTHLLSLALCALTLLGCKGRDTSSQGDGSGVQANKLQNQYNQVAAMITLYQAVP